MKCSICKRKKHIFAYRIQIDDEVRFCCLPCYDKAKKTGEDIIRPFIAKMIKENPKANNIIAIDISCKNRAE